MTRESEWWEIRMQLWRIAARTAFVLWATVASGQWSRSVHGTVRDQDGHLLVGAAVQIQNDSTLEMRSYITQADGAYHFEGLSRNDTYQLQALYHGILGPDKHLSKFDSRTKNAVDLKIDLSHPHH
jgi:hypothetical protein